MLTFLYSSKFEKKLGMVIIHIYFHLKHYVKCKFLLKCIHSITIQNIKIANFAYYEKTRMKQYKNDNIVNFVYYGKILMTENQ